jgi:hypothetical protein
MEVRRCAEHIIARQEGQMVAEHAPRYFGREQTVYDPDITFPYPPNPARCTMVARLRIACSKAQRRAFRTVSTIRQTASARYSPSCQMADGVQRRPNPVMMLDRLTHHCGIGTGTDSWRFRNLN